jgi:hypothetical protein
MTEIKLFLTIDIIRAVLGGAEIHCPLEEEGIELVLLCKPETQDQFKNEVQTAMLRYLPPAPNKH